MIGLIELALLMSLPCVTLMLVAGMTLHGVYLNYIRRGDGDIMRLGNE